MRFLRDIPFGMEEYRTLEKAVAKNRTPVMATGLTAIHKAHMIYSMCARLKRRALVLAGDEAEAARLCADLQAMGSKVMNYPLRDMTFREIEGVSGEFMH